MPTLTATLATAPDAAAVFALLASAGAHLAAHGYSNWQPPYPRERIERDISAGAVWIVRDSASDGTPVATYMLRAAPVRAYTGIVWGAPDANARYLNRLAVHATRMGEGIGAWCLAYIAECCARDGVSAVRCDVVAGNLPLRRFYERAGYEVRGAREHSGWEFAVYETLIANNG